jgi:hypothetical protein
MEGLELKFMEYTEVHQPPSIKLEIKKRKLSEFLISLSEPPLSEPIPNTKIRKLNDEIMTVRRYDQYQN